MDRQIDVPTQSELGEPGSEKVKVLEELCSKLTAANESVTQDRDREAKKAKLLERELLALRASTEELRKIQGLQQGGQDVALTEQKLREKSEEIDRLRRDLEAAQQAGAGGAGPGAASHSKVHSSSEPGSPELANPDHIEKLRAVIRGQQEEILKLREQIVSMRRLPPPVEVVTQEKFVEVPTVEVRTVEIENAEKVGALMGRVRELEQEGRLKDVTIADWQSKCAQLEQMPGKVVPSVVEVEDTSKMRQLLGMLNQAHAELAQLRKTVLDRAPVKTEIEYVDREVYIEVPRIQEVAVGNPQETAQMQRLLSMKDEELARMREDLNHHRENAVRLERQLQETTGLLQQRMGGSPSGGVLPRPTAIDATLAEYGRSVRLPPMQKVNEVADGTSARFYFGDLLVDVRLIGSDLFATNLTDNVTLAFREFAQVYGEQRLPPGSSGALSAPLRTAYPSTAADLQAHRIGVPPGSSRAVTPAGGRIPSTSGPSFQYGGGAEQPGPVTQPAVPNATPMQYGPGPVTKVKDDGDQFNSLVSWVLGEPQAGTGAPR